MTAALATKPMSDSTLAKEIETYNAKLTELVASAGKYVLIKDAEIIGIYDTYADALKVGYERFQLKPFLVKQIVPTEQIQFFTRDLACPA